MKYLLNTFIAIILCVAISQLIVAQAPNDSIKGEVEDQSYLNYVEGSQFNSTLTYGSFKDARDGKTYKTIKIGKQTWMAENLCYKTKKSWSFENKESNDAKCGRYYDGDDAKTACPEGWHLPSDAEWNELVNYLGGEKEAGGKLKSTVGWKSPNAGASNISGFTGLATGFGYTDGRFQRLGEKNRYWSATANGTDEAWRHGQRYEYGLSYRASAGKSTNLFSIRCVKN